jgi:hypothetical protein
MADSVADTPYKGAEERTYYMNFDTRLEVGKLVATRVTINRVVINYNIADDPNVNDIIEAIGSNNAGVPF